MARNERMLKAEKEIERRVQATNSAGSHPQALGIEPYLRRNLMIFKQKNAPAVSAAEACVIHPLQRIAR